MFAKGAQQARTATETASASVCLHPCKFSIVNTGGASGPSRQPQSDHRRGRSCVELVQGGTSCTLVINQASFSGLVLSFLPFFFNPTVSCALVIVSKLHEAQDVQKPPTSSCETEAGHKCGTPKQDNISIIDSIKMGGSQMEMQLLKAKNYFKNSPKD